MQAPSRRRPPADADYLFSVLPFPSSPVFPSLDASKPFPCFTLYYTFGAAVLPGT